MPENIDHTMYVSNSNYEKEVAGHIVKVLNCNIWKANTMKRKFRSPKNILTGDML